MVHTELLETLKIRFENNMHRHGELLWEDIEKKLVNNPEKLDSLQQMEDTGGEPDVIIFRDDGSGPMYVDCSKETPTGRRSICYDQPAEAQRIKKGVIPQGNAISLAEKMGIEILSEVQYHQLQFVEEFDTKTSSWVKTPEGIRELGGAIFADYRYGHVFVYHNSAGSFYSSRGFRGCLKI